MSRSSTAGQSQHSASSSTKLQGKLNQEALMIIALRKMQAKKSDHMDNKQAMRAYRQAKSKSKSFSTQLMKEPEIIEEEELITDQDHLPTPRLVEKLDATETPRDYIYQEQIGHKHPRGPYAQKHQHGDNNSSQGVIQTGQSYPVLGQTRIKRPSGAFKSGAVPSMQQKRMIDINIDQTDESERSNHN